MAEVLKIVCIVQMRIMRLAYDLQRSYCSPRSDNEHPLVFAGLSVDLRRHCRRLVSEVVGRTSRAS